MNNNAIKWIYKNTKFCFVPIVILTLANILFAAFSLAMAYITKQIIDSAVKTDYDGVVKYGVILAVIVIFSFVLRLIFRNLDERFRVKAELRLKNSFFEKIITREHLKITKFHSGDLQNRMFSDVSIVSSGVMTLLPSLADLLTTVIGAFIMLSVIDLSFAFLFLAVGVVVLIATLIFRNKIKNYHKDVQTKDSRVHSFIQEVLINLLAVKVFNSKGSAQRKTKSLLEDYKASRLRRSAFMIFMTSAVAFIFEIGFAYALVWGAVGIYNGVVTYGTLAQALQLIGKIQSPFASFSFISSEFFRIVGSAERLMEIENIDGEEEKIDCSDLYKDITSIEFKNVTFAYEDEDVLENVSFTIDKNTFTAVTGSSGIGKSTLLKLMLGVCKPQSGEIVINTNAGKLDVTNGIDNLFTYVPQGNLIFSGTIKENICFISDSVNDEQLKKAVEISCADEFVQNLPQGIDTVIGENGIGLSEGQAQRIAIARAILSGNKILLLDEATSALDEETERKLLANLKGVEDITCIAVTHKSAALDISEKILKFEDRSVYEEKCINE